MKWFILLVIIFILYKYLKKSNNIEHLNYERNAFDNKMTSDNSDPLQKIKLNKKLHNLILKTRDYYLMNPQVYRNILNNLNSFIELYQICLINTQITNRLYSNLQNLRKEILNDFISISIKDKSNSNITPIINDLNNILNEYINNIYLIHEDMLLKNGLNYNTKLFTKNNIDGYNNFQDYFTPDIPHSYYRI